MTRFQRYNAALGLFLLVVLAIAGWRSVKAQEFDYAVRANTSLATALCLDVMIARVLPQPAFEQAGFTYRKDIRPVNSFGVQPSPGHYFDAPTDTAKAQVDAPDRIAGICTVFTKHLNQPDLNKVVSDTILRRFPNVQSRGPGQWSIATQGGLPLLIGTQTIGTNNRFETPGTVSVSMSYPG